MQSSRKHRHLGAAALLSAGALAACSSTSATPSPTTASGGQQPTGARSAAVDELAPLLSPPTQLLVSTPLSKKPPAGKSLYYLSNGSPLAEATGQGVSAASKALQWSFHVVAVDQNNPSTIPSGILSAVNSGADVVIISATPTAVYQSALPTAQARGTVVIDTSSGNTRVPGVAAYVNNAPQSGPVWGRLAGLAAVVDAERAGVAAHAVIATSPVFTTILGPTDAAMRQTIARVCSACSVDTLEVGFGQIVNGQGPAAVVSYLQSHPKVNYVLEDASLLDQGLPQALKGAGLSAVKVVGVAALAPQVASLKAGVEQAWVAISLQVQGWMQVDAAARQLVGDDPTVYDKVAVPSYVITRQKPDMPIDVPADFAEQFKRMWQVA